MCHRHMPVCEANVNFPTMAACQEKMPEIQQRGLPLDASVFHPKKRIFSLPSFLSCLPLWIALVLFPLLDVAMASCRQAEIHMNLVSFQCPEK